MLLTSTVDELTFGVEMNAFCIEDEHFSAGDKRIENVRWNFSHTHTHTQIAPSDFQTQLMLR